MWSKLWKCGCAVLGCAAVLVNAGCCSSAKGSCVKTVAVKEPCAPKDPCVKATGDLVDLPDAKPGECYAKVFVPPTFKTTTERVVVREASEQIEIVPAKYDWVEERVVVKEASTILKEIPAEYAVKEQTIQVAPAHVDWEINKNANCDLPANQPAKDVFCLVEHPPLQRTVRTECQVRPASVETVTIPAEYETIRVQKLVTPATTRRICIPAEYETVEKTVKVCDGHMAWQRVVCEWPDRAVTMEGPNGSTIIEREVEIRNDSQIRNDAQTRNDIDNLDSNVNREVNVSPQTINAVKSALADKGFTPGPMNGELNARDWVALGEFQRKNGLPVGDLNPETMRELGVEMQ
jgi:hypothetical protein